MAVLALCAVSSVAPAQARNTDDFSWSGRVPAGGSLRIRNLAGSINVERSSSGQVEVTGRKEYRRGDPADVRFEVVPQGNDVTICAIWFEGNCVDGQEKSGPRRDDDNRNNDVSVIFTVRLPAGVRLDASGVSADINIKGVTAGVSANSVSGDVVIDDVSGDIKLNSVSGDVKVTGASTGSIKANSVSGDVILTVDQLTGSDALEFNTVSGNVDITLPANLDATVTMSTVSGELKSDFPMTMQGEQRSRNVEARIGAGGRSLKFHSVSGDVILRRG
jgi:hypothetical protein